MGVCFLQFDAFVHTMKLYIGRRRNASRSRKLGTRMDMNDHFNTKLSLSAQKDPFCVLD
jgi:hypothetical protein